MGARNSKLLLSQTHHLENCQQTGQKDKPLSKQLAWTLQDQQGTNSRQKKKTGKAYSLLSACSLTRAVHLKLLPNQTAEEFILYLKWLIMRKGHPRKINSYNEQSFVASAKWLNGVVRHEQLQNYLAHQEIRLQFYLSRAPRWRVDNFRGLWAS